MFRYGVDYYPEHWPEERWETDARLMQEAGINVVRLAEFAWVKMEPEEGRFDFDWLERAIGILAKRGIGSVLGTPTAAAPAWLGQKYPEVFRVDSTGRRITYGHRQHSCINAPRFREGSDRVVAAMVDRFGKNPNVLGWQIDNEFGPLCYCDICGSQFREWLKKRYQSLDALNAAWGTIFWSHTYTGWEQIPVPLDQGGPHNMGLTLDYRRFLADSYTSFEMSQIGIIRKLSPGKPITHNFMGFWPEALNYYDLAKPLDFVSWDNYPAFSAHDKSARPMISLNHDQTRGLKGKNFWVMEEQSGPGGWGDMGPAPKPGQIRLWSIQAVGRGADAIVYFRWRPCRWGTEQYWHGILDHDGSTNRRYQEVKDTGADLNRVWEQIEGSTVSADVAFINDYESRFAFQYQRGNPQFSYVGLTMELYRPLHRRNIMVDVVPPEADLSKYKLAVVPAMFLLDPETAARLKEFVRNGGTLISTFRTAVKDEANAIVNEPIPAGLTDLFGARVAEYTSIPQGVADEVDWSLPGAQPFGAASVWADALELQGAKAIATYASGFGQGEPAASLNEYGSGRAIYIGTWLTGDAADSVMGHIAERAGVTGVMATPEGVEASARAKDGRTFVFLTNHEDAEKAVPVQNLTPILGDLCDDNTVLLPPYGVMVFEKK